ncbi:MAG: nucleotidyltransferase domain-containing protein [Candidatus Altiarchaeota archaeon]
MGGREHIIEKLKEFKERLSKDIPIERLILFGSRVHSKSRRDSDVDLIIVSPKFRKLDFFQRGAKMYNYWTLNLPVDFLCYTPEEFEKLSKGVTIVSEAIKEGIVI